MKMVIIDDNNHRQVLLDYPLNSATEQWRFRGGPRGHASQSQNFKVSPKIQN